MTIVSERLGFVFIKRRATTPERTVRLGLLKENPQAWEIEEIFTPELDELTRKRMAPVFELLEYPYLQR